MSEIDRIISEVGGDEPRLGTDYKGRPLADPLTLEQAKRLSEHSEYTVSSTEFASDDDLFEIVGEVQTDWPEAEILFGGSLGQISYLDTMYVVYENIKQGPTPESEDAAFEEYAVLRFKHSMPCGDEKNAGVCPCCDGRVTIVNEYFRYPDRDEYLLAAPNEFDFREHEDRGKYLRLWWDD